jgi:hypothetical protein
MWLDVQCMQINVQPEGDVTAVTDTNNVSLLFIDDFQ